MHFRLSREGADWSVSGSIVSGQRENGFFVAHDLNVILRNWLNRATGWYLSLSQVEA